MTTGIEAPSVRAATDSLDMDVPIEKVTDFPSIMSYDVMSTTALVIDEQVVLAGRIPSVDELHGFLTAVRS